MYADKLVEPNELPDSEQQKLLSRRTEKQGEKGEASKGSDNKQTKPLSPLDENDEQDSCNKDKQVYINDGVEYVGCFGQNEKECVLFTFGVWAVH